MHSTRLVKSSERITFYFQTMRDDRDSDWWIIAIVAMLCVAIARPLLAISPRQLSWSKEYSRAADLELSDTFGRGTINDEEEQFTGQQGEYSFLLQRPRRRPSGMI